MNLNAQAVRCGLYGLIGPYGKGKSNWKGTYSKATLKILYNYVGTHAVAIVKNVKSGKVGMVHEARVKEFIAYVVL